MQTPSFEWNAFSMWNDAELGDGGLLVAAQLTLHVNGRRCAHAAKTHINWWLNID